MRILRRGSTNANVLDNIAGCGSCVHPFRALVLLSNTFSVRCSRGNIELVSLLHSG